MNKLEYVETLIKWANDENIDLGNIVVSHGGSMLLLGLIKSTDDIDIEVSNEVFNKFFNDQSYYRKEISDGRFLVRVTDKIDIHAPVKDHGDLLVVDGSGIVYRGVQGTLEDYLKLNRPKDQPKIELLKQMINLGINNVSDILGSKPGMFRKGSFKSNS